MVGEFALTSTAADDAVASQIGMKAEKYRRLSRIADASTPVSLDVCRPGVSAVAQNPHRETSLRILALDAAIPKLPRLEFIVITALRTGQTNREIAQRLHVTEGRLSQIKTRAISHIRSALGLPQPAQA